MNSRWPELLIDLVGTGLIFAAFAAYHKWSAATSSGPTVEPEDVATARCHLVPTGTDKWIAPAPYQGLRVSFVKVVDEEQRVLYTRIVVDSEKDDLIPLTLRPETASDRRRGASEIEVGDPSFDDQFWITGPTTTVLAALDERTRLSLLILRSELKLEIQGGTLLGRVDRDTTSPELKGLVLARSLERLLATAQRLRRSSTVERLAENARTDRVAAVRLSNLRALVREHLDHPLMAEVLPAACTDKDLAVRVQAAVALGPQGRAVLLDVVRDEEEEDEPVARAIRALGTELPIASVSAILGRALRVRQMETANACLETLGRHADESALALLVKVMSVEHGELAMASAAAIGATGLTAAEEPLLVAMSRAEPGLELALTKALARIGTVRAVGPLLALEKREGVDATVRRAARQAVAEVQSRLGGASPGQLSLAAAEAGALSLADDVSGRLSLEEPKPAAPDPKVRPRSRQ